MEYHRGACGAFILIAAMCASNSALAQEESKGVEVVNDSALDTIVVTAARVEKPISAIPNTVKVLGACGDSCTKEDGISCIDERSLARSSISTRTKTSGAPGSAARFTVVPARINPRYVTSSASSLRKA